jgi:hypothetical protein
MFKLKLLLAVTVFGAVFLLATGLLDLGRVRDDGGFEWRPRVDRAGIDRLGRRAWHAATDAARDVAGGGASKDEAPAPEQPERTLVLR